MQLWPDPNIRLGKAILGSNPKLSPGRLGRGDEHRFDKGDAETQILRITSDILRGDFDTVNTRSVGMDL